MMQIYVNFEGFASIISAFFGVDNIMTSDHVMPGCLVESQEANIWDESEEVRLR